MERRDIELPSARESSTELKDPIVAMERRLSVLLIETHSKSDNADPKRVTPKSDTIEPQVNRLRSDTAEPR